MNAAPERRTQRGVAGSDGVQTKPRAQAMTRGQAIAAKCRDCIYDSCAGGTWREQVGCCTAVGCPLWRFRPLPRNAPHWMVKRDASELPSGWLTLPQTDAIEHLRSLGDRMLGVAPLAQSVHGKVAHETAKVGVPDADQGAPP